MEKRDGIRDGYCKQLTELLSHVKGEKINIAAEVYYLILKEENRGAAFQFFLENANTIDSSKEREAERYFTAAEEQKLANDCTQLAVGILDNIIGKNLDEDTFYDELWRRGIEENINLAEEKEKIYALYRIWMDGRIPYFKLENGLLLSNEIFTEITKEKIEAIKKCIYILNSRFSQRTERSSHLLKILDACDTEAEKAVLLAHILFIAESSVRLPKT